MIRLKKELLMNKPSTINPRNPIRRRVSGFTNSKEVLLISVESLKEEVIRANIIGIVREEPITHPSTGSVCIQGNRRVLQLPLCLFGQEIPPMLMGLIVW